MLMCRYRLASRLRQRSLPSLHGRMVQRVPSLSIAIAPLDWLQWFASAAASRRPTLPLSRPCCFEQSTVGCWGKVLAAADQTTRSVLSCLSPYMVALINSTLSVLELHPSWHRREVWIDCPFFAPHAPLCWDLDAHLFLLCADSPPPLRWYCHLVVLCHTDSRVL